MTLMLGLGRARYNREHRLAADNLSAYIDGELAAAEHSRLERHLAECADCRRDVETLQATVALLRRVPLKPVPRSFALPTSARAVQARHRRWNSAFSVMRTATVTIATMLVLVFVGDAALTTGLVSLPSGRTASEGMALLAPDQGEAPVEEVQPMIAEGAPEAAPQVKPESGNDLHAGAEAAPPAEAPAPSETARALQPPRETWPGPKGQPRGTEGGGGGDVAGLGSAGDAGGGGGVGGGADTGGPVPAMPRTNEVGGGAPAEGELEAAPAAEAQAESLTQSADTRETPAEAPQPEAMVAPKLAPTPEPEPTPEYSRAAPPAEPTVAADAVESPTPEALGMEAEPRQYAPDRAGEPTAEAVRVMPLDRKPEATWWQAWRSLRLLVGFLAGMLLIALAGTIWAGYKRGTL